MGQRRRLPRRPYSLAACVVGWRGRPGRVMCAQVMQRLADLLDGGLDSGTREAFRRHLLDCIDCAACVESFRATIDTLRGIGQDDLDPVLRERLLSLSTRHLTDLD